MREVLNVLVKRCMLQIVGGFMFYSGGEKFIDISNDVLSEATTFNKSHGLDLAAADGNLLIPIHILIDETYQNLRPKQIQIFDSDMLKREEIKDILNVRDHFLMLDISNAKNLEIVTEFL